jgi:hypothetical protein
MRLLMLELDRHLLSAVARGLQQEGVEVVGVSSFDAAQALARRQRFDAAVLDCDALDAGELSGLGGLPLIFTSSLPGLAGGPLPLQGSVLQKPFTNSQLLSVVHGSCGALRIEGKGLVEVLRGANSRDESVTFEIGVARVFMERGEVVHAECAETRGEAALALALTQGGRDVVRLPLRSLLRSIRRPFQALMLDLLRQLEEREGHTGGALAGPSRAEPEEPRS